MDRQEILACTVEELKNHLTRLQLSTTGRKPTLQSRLLEHYNLDEEPEETFSEARDSSPTYRNSVFTLRDIRESLVPFSGTGYPDVDQWITEFEENALIVEWNDVQKFIYAKQLLKGAAHIFIRGQKNVNSWSKLKENLKTEFGKKLSTIEIHKMLANKQKENSETYLEYLYTIIEIAQPANIDDESIIEYFVNGIQDSKLNKTFLYEARSIEDLKQKIKVYEKLKRSRRQPQQFGQPYMQKTDKKCIICPHLNNHTTQECRKQKKTCFRCNQQGHLAKYCTQENLPQNTPRPNNTQKNTRNNSNGKNNNNSTPNSDLQNRLVQSAIRIYKEIKIQNKTIKTLLDTGSDICLLTKSALNGIENVKLIKETAFILGIAQQRVDTLGYIETEIETDNVKFPCTFHIANDEDLGFTCILGNDILKQININITSNGANFSLITNDTNFLAGRVFRAICALNIEEELTLDIPQTVPKNIELKLKHLITNYNPRQEEQSPISMSIVTTDDVPVFQHPRRISLNDQKTVATQVGEWLEKGIIRRSNSQYASPIVLVPKKDGSKRLCCDYRKLNEKIVRDNFPMLLIDDALQRLEGAKIFTTIDLKNGFFHVPVEENSKKFTSFVTHHGQFEFNFVPFGISNSPAVFCRFISTIFQDMIISNQIIAYMDDIIIPTKTIDDNLTILYEIFNKAEKFNLQINWKKCQFLQNKVKFLGYEVSDSKITPSKEKVTAVLNYNVPRDTKSLQRFLGLTSYFRRFIENHATIAKPLTDLLSKNAKFEFKEEQFLAFNELKLALTRAPVLKMYNQYAYTEVHTDASMYGYGAILLQKDSETQKLHPVEFMSRKTTQCEQKYHSYELEVLAIIEALKKWRCFLLGRKFTLITDCNAFKGTMTKKDVPLRVTRWIMFLQDYDFETQHRSGTKMRHVDALSRLRSLLIEKPLCEKIIQAQKQDMFIGTLKEIVKEEGHNDFFIKHNILYQDREKELIVTPQSMEKEIILSAHNQGHFSAKRTAEIVKKNFYIQELEKKAKSVTQNYIECILVETKASKKEGLTNMITKPGIPLHTLHIDHIGPLDKTKKQYNFILTVVDSFSKFTWIYPTKTTTAEEVLKKLENHSAVFGHPHTIVSDRGTAFTAKIFTEYCVANGINHHLITTGVPRENGQVERIHRIIISVLAKLCLNKKDNWYKYTNRVQQYLNSTPPRSTKIEPFKVLTGLEMRLPGLTEIKELIDEEILNEIEEERNEIREIARENIGKIQEENKKTFNKKRTEGKGYQIGDIVAIKRTQFGTNLKLKPKFLGPYKITKVKRGGRYNVEKIGEEEGPKITTTINEYIKPWSDQFGTN